MRNPAQRLGGHRGTGWERQSPAPLTGERAGRRSSTWYSACSPLTTPQRFQGPWTVQGFDSGAEQTNGTGCFKEPDPELLRGILGLVPAVDSMIPKAPDLTKGGGLEFPDTQPSLNQSDGAGAGLAGRRVIATSLLSGPRNWAYVSASGIFMRKTCWLDPSEACSVCPLIWREMSRIIKGARLELQICSCVSTEITQNGNLDTSGPDFSFLDKATLIRLAVLETTDNAAFRSCSRFWIGTHIDSVTQPQRWSTETENWKVN